MSWGSYRGSWNGYRAYLGAETTPGRTASSYREHRGPLPQPARRHHYHDHPPYPHRTYGDYTFIESRGWWPRWFPYWDQRWFDYWWYLYDYFGGDAYPEYAEYMRDAYLRQNAPQWGLVISGWLGAEPQRGIVPRHGSPSLGPARGIVPTHGSPRLGPVDRDRDRDDRRDYGGDRQRYRHPHDYYGDYVIVENAWWPSWFPYWDPAWIRYWQQLYYAYGGDAYADYAQYARDAYLRSLARQWGWI